MLNENTKNRLTDIYNHFGRENQTEKLFEEVFEMLIETPDSHNHFTEMVDVWIVLTQLLLSHEDKALEEIEHKISRTEKRIKENYYL